MDSPDGCQAATCPELKSQSFTVANKCRIKKTVKEEIDACKHSAFPKMCVCVCVCVHLLINGFGGIDKIPGNGQ